ncbi:MAG TPA: chromate transporter [Reyranella sp.]|nr:chromate transporter [Reyranella sp.]
MSDQAAAGTVRQPTLGSIFSTFLLIGATSVGGGVVAYLRANLVGKRAWLDDVAFVELLSISQTLPGLNAVNMSILVGDRLRGGWGALAATIGMCLPGGLLMTAAGAAYGLQVDAPPVTAALHGIAAAAVGLVLAVLVQVGAKALSRTADYVFAGATAAAIVFLHVPVLYALIGMGTVAIWWNRPR